MDAKRRQLLAAVEAHRRQAPPAVRAEPATAAQPVAIVGLSGYLPGCMSVEAFWRALDRDQPLLQEIPRARFDIDAHFDPEGSDPSKSHSRWGGFIPRIEDFDPEFFGVSHGEAARMDPRQRLLLRSAYNTFENAGYAPATLRESRTGVFVAIEDNEYLAHLQSAGVEMADPFGHAPSMVASRLSYFFDLRGPSEVINTMCSGAAVALHRAVVALRNGEVEQALVGAANLLLRPELFVSLSRLGQLSRGKEVWSFGERASGYLRAEGVASVLLKPLDRAERDGDAIYAVIRNSVVAFNGRGGTSIASPSAASHAALIQECYQTAGVDARAVEYIEAQGMGTPVADIAEWDACNRALRELAQRQGVSLEAGQCRISTLKPMMGHMHSASALGALFKVIRSLETDTVHGIIGFDQPNRFLDQDAQPCRLARESSAWRRKGQPRLAGVHSYGSGGVNAHLLIEEYLPRRDARPLEGHGPQVVPLSAGAPDLLPGMARSLRQALDAQPSGSVYAVARTLQQGRDALRFRVAFVAESVADLQAQLQAYEEGRRSSTALEGVAEPGGEDRPNGEGDTEPRSAAQRWVQGGAVRWSRSGGADAFERMRLPGYPFALRRCWVEGRDTAAPVHASTGVLFQLKRVNGERHQVRVSFDGGEFLFRDHQVATTPILPGAAYLELARAAAVACDFTRPSELTDVVWQRPLREDARGDVRVVFSEAGTGQASFQVVSQSHGTVGGETVHVRGQLASSSHPREAPRRLPELEGRCPERLDGDAAYQWLTQAGLEYGPGFRGIQHCRFGEGEVVATVALPAGADAGNNVVLHPSLLDSALQTCVLLQLARRRREGGMPEVASAPAIVPFSLSRVTVHRALPRVMVVHSRFVPAGSESAPSFDTVLLTEDGEALVTLQGVCFRPSPQAAKEAGRIEAEQYVWREREVDATANGAMAPVHRISLRLCRDLDIPGSELLPVDGLNPAEVLLRAMDAVLQRLRALEHSGPRAPCRVEIWCDRGSPAAVCEGLWSFLQSLQLEHRNVEGQVVRLDDVGGRHWVEEVVERERRQGRGDSAVTYRDRKRFVRTAVRVPWPVPASRPELLAQGRKTYGVVGGGALGLALAHWLVEQCDADVIIASRSGRPLSAGPQASSRLRWCKLDVTDPRDVEQAVGEWAREARLEGLLFTVGHVEPGPALAKTDRELRRTVAPKCLGALNLLEQCHRLPCRFVALFSSQASRGEYQHSDYAAANGFLNGLADGFGAEGAPRFTNRLGEPLSVISLSWPQWRDGGMRLSRELSELLASSQGLIPMPNQVGFTALREVVRSGMRHVAIQYRLSEQPRKEAVVPAQAVDADARAKAEQTVRDVVGSYLGQPAHALDMEAELSALGVTSLAIVELGLALHRRHGIRVQPARFFQYTTPSQLRDFVAQELSKRASPAHAQVAAPESPARAAPRERTEPIAVVGIHARFPGAEDVDAFWRNIVEGKRCLSEVPASRQEALLALAGDGSDVTRPRWGGFIEGVDEFDPRFFSISPQEAELMDPQQRLLLASVWSALENGGLIPEQFARTSTGVFVAAAPGEYPRVVSIPLSHPLGTTAVTASIAPNRISHVFNFKGPSEYCDTACSSALTAVHRACQAIRSGECEQAVVSAINLLLSPTTFTGFEAMEYLSVDGSCRPFQPEARGFVRSEGVGTLVLKPLSRAVADGDIIYGLVRGSGVAHGGRGLSLTAVNPLGMKDAIVSAYRAAGVSARTVSYVEAHGVGSPLADGAEVEAIKAAFREVDESARDGDPHVCHLSSLKPCIGHGELVSGMAALIKALMALRHAVLPGLPGFTQWHEDISVADSPLKVSSDSQPWRTLTGAEPSPRRAGVNSFGFGGVNAHVLLESYAADKRPTGDSEAPRLFVFSARTAERLQEVARRLSSFLASNSDIVMADLAYTLQTGRHAFSCRLAVVARDRNELAAALSTYLASPERTSWAGTPIHVGEVDGSTRLGKFLSEAAGASLVESLLAERGLERLAEYWVLGGHVPWARLHEGADVKRIPLPTYPFARERYWLASGGADSQASAHDVPLSPKGRGVEAISEAIREQLSLALSVPRAQLGDNVNARDLGADSITMMRLAQVLARTLGVDVRLRDLVDRPTIAAIASHVAALVRGREPRVEDTVPVAVPEQDALDMLKEGLLSIEDVAARLENDAHDNA
ncbi:polyketide synthase dehydratase domain-containing protein [Myxococcus xanthus]|uniref:beta-ketoacyl synthase N-terminal-like domain-containing protein n=1 Tax=Myxococcus xanthus TaxID=34 RepID=UPI0019178720|nr:beta-ketoacyl synthase N-terminal-like domain-containing protein [Myxococcus xanthus]QQR41442.1 polyketide synthase dehydratase domain-containing protein [Myxococcus xanthus]